MARREPTVLAIRPGMTLRAAEQLLIEATLASVDGDKKLAAEQLGISLKTLYERLKLYAAVRQAVAGRKPA